MRWGCPQKRKCTLEFSDAKQPHRQLSIVAAKADIRINHKVGLIGKHRHIVDDEMTGSPDRPPVCIDLLATDRKVIVVVDEAR